MAKIWSNSDIMERENRSPKKFAPNPSWLYPPVRYNIFSRNTKPSAMYTATRRTSFRLSVSRELEEYIPKCFSISSSHATKI